MTLVKIDQAPEIKKIRVAQPYIVHPETKQIYGFYNVIVKWADGTRKTFASEEEANAHIERRGVNQAALEAEFPQGFRRAVEILRSYDVKEEEEPTVSDECDVMLTAVAADSKVAVIKKLRELTGQGLKESKDLATNLPSKIREAVTREEAEDVKKQLEAVGGTVTIK